MRGPLVPCPVCSPGAAPAAEARGCPGTSWIRTGSPGGSPRNGGVCPGHRARTGGCLLQEKRGIFCLPGSSNVGAAAGLGRDLGTTQPLRCPPGAGRAPHSPEAG